MIKGKKINDSHWTTFFNKVKLPDDFLNNMDHDIQDILFKYAKSDTIKKIFTSSDNYIGFSKEDFNRTTTIEGCKQLIQYQKDCFEALFNRQDFVSSLKDEFNAQTDKICDKIMDFNTIKLSGPVNAGHKTEIRKYRDVFDICYKHFNIDCKPKVDITGSNAYKFYSKIYKLYHNTTQDPKKYVNNDSIYQELYNEVHSWA